MAYTYELVRGNEGSSTITNVLVNGKPIKPCFMRGLKKAQATRLWREYGAPTEFTNPFSGVSRVLNVLESSILGFCLAWYRRYSMGDLSIPIQVYDDMKYLLLELNSDAYYDLLD